MTYRYVQINKFWQTKVRLLFLLLCYGSCGSCGCCCHHGGCGHFCHGCVDAHELSLLSLFHFISIKLKNASLKDGRTEGQKDRQTSPHKEMLGDI